MELQHRWISATGHSAEWLRTDRDDAYDEAARGIFAASAEDPHYLGGIASKVTIRLEDGTKLQYRRAK